MKKMTIFAILIFCFVPAVVFSSAKTSKEYISDLSSSEESVVITAQKWLGENKEKTAVPALLQLLKTSPNPKIRLNSAVALGLIEEKSVVDDLTVQLLQESNSDVRYAIVLAVMRIGIDNREQYDRLIQAKEKETDPIIIDFVEKMESKLQVK